jgi:GNAT superfamily N-acetyltransferase
MVFLFEIVDGAANAAILVLMPRARRPLAVHMNAPPHAVALASPDDVGPLPEIERLAGLQFKAYPELGIPEQLYDDTNSVNTFAAAQRAGRLWVAHADRQPVGFALVIDVDSYAHLDELDVVPRYGRRGIGAALLAAVCAWATDAGYRTVTLRTFRDVPWNAPFYEKRGFRVVESHTLSAGHVALELMERQRGLRTDLSVTMAYSPVGG